MTQKVSTASSVKNPYRADPKLTIKEKVCSKAACHKAGQMQPVSNFSKAGVSNGVQLFRPNCNVCRRKIDKERKAEIRAALKAIEAKAKRDKEPMPRPARNTLYTKVLSRLWTEEGMRDMQEE